VIIIPDGMGRLPAQVTGASRLLAPHSLLLAAEIARFTVPSEIS